LLDYDEHGEASLDGARVSTQPVCSHPSILFTWERERERERERVYNIILAISEPPPLDF